MMAILEHAVRVDHFRRRKGNVFFGVRTLADAFYLEKLARYAAASHGKLEITIALSDQSVDAAAHPDYPSLKLANGMVHDVAARAMNGNYDNAMTYVAGPPVMVDAAIRALIVGGVPISDIRYDKFG
jgi:toluene monooxygenase electron transfer component